MNYDTGNNFCFFGYWWPAG